MSNTLNDIVITSSALKHSGGAERYTRDLIRGFHQLGIRPKLYAREIDRSLIEASWVSSRLLSVRWAPRKLRARAFAWQFKRIVALGQPDCILSINHTTSSDIALCVGTHAGWLETSGRARRHSDRRQIELERKAYRNARVIVAHSGLMAQELKRFYGIPEEKIRVMYPPVDPFRFSPLSESERMTVREQFSLPHDKILFFFSSTSHTRKGYDLLQTYFQQTSLPVCLVVAGRPVQETTETIRSVGYQCDIERLFSAVDFTVVPSVYEPFGFVAVESVMCGTPIVVADNVGAAEIISAAAKFSFSRDLETTFEHAIEAAVAQALAGHARIARPRDSVLYDSRIDTHVAEIYALMEQLQPKK